MLKDLLSSLGEDRLIVMVNTRVPRPWESIVNKTLAEVAKDFSNVAIVDWYGASENKASYFARDGVHLKSEEAKNYASLLAKAIKPES